MVACVWGRKSVCLCVACVCVSLAVGDEFYVLKNLCMCNM